MTNLALDLYWNPDRGDNFVTATGQGRADALAAGYAMVRREAFLFPSTLPGVVPLKLYWHPDRGDNMTAATPAAEQDAINNGYEFVRVEGYVKSSPEPGTIPLKLYFSNDRDDYFLTATAPGETAAVAAGYRFIRVEGYASYEPPIRSTHVRSEVGAVIPGDAIMETTVTVDKNGVLEAITKTTNYATFWGFQGGVFVFFSDAQGTTINGRSIKREPFGVQGAAYGFSRRQDPWTDQVPIADVPRIEDVHIFHFLTGINLVRELNRITGIIQASAGTVGAVAQIVADIKGVGAKGK